jgi:hypothetical protein
VDTLDYSGQGLHLDGGTFICDQGKPLIRHFYLQRPLSDCLSSPLSPYFPLVSSSMLNRMVSERPAPRLSERC